MSRTDVRIQKASSNDAALIADLGRRTFVEAFGRYNDPDELKTYLSLAFALNRIAAELADPKATFLLAFAAAVPIGYAKLRAGQAPSCVQGPHPIELERLYVQQNALAAGCGGALMNFCLDQARQKGYERMWLGVWERNARARRFYRKWGFVEVGRKDFAVGRDVQKDIIMTKELQRPQASVWWGAMG